LKPNVNMKNLFILSILLLPSLGIARNAHYNVGISTGLYAYNYQDDKGETELESTTVPFTLFAEMETSRVNKVYIGLREFDLEVDATNSGNLGTNIESIQFEATWLRKFKMTRNFKPWFGVGIRSSLVETSLRHTVDRDGFLLETFNNTDNTFLALVLKTTADWEIGEGWYINADASVDQPIGDGLQGFGFSLGIKYEL